jgi:hypothetical protein
LQRLSQKDYTAFPVADLRTAGMLARFDHQLQGLRPTGHPLTFNPVIRSTLPTLLPLERASR